MKAILNEIKKLKVLVIGDVMLDHYIWGDANRISPEAPVPVVSVNRDTYAPGGAANVALNLAGLGAETYVAGWVGEDEPGDRLQALFKENKIELIPSFVSKDKTTILKTRVLVQNQQLCRLDRELQPKDYAVSEHSMIEDLIKKTEEVDVVILSDYSKGIIDQRVILNVQEAAQKANTFVAIDPKPRRPLRYKNINLLTPNRNEALQLAGIDIGPHDRFPSSRVCLNIWEKYRPEYLVVTLGSEGMLISEAGEITRQIPTSAQEVFDVSGAGDTVISALSLAMAAKVNIADSAAFANFAAGIVVGKIGTVPITADEIEDAYEG
tara:strand:- start:198 stop:1166 length:969 start_codon:yes stop_codon:yes gene_type:complete